MGSFKKKAGLVCGIQQRNKKNIPARDQKSQPSKKLAPALVSANVQGEERVGVGLPPEVEVGMGVGEGEGRLELEEPEAMEETMTGFPPAVGTGVDEDGFCRLPGLATQ